VPHDLVQKAFTVEFKGTSNNLETINAEERNTYVSSIYFEHVICWNPAKVIFMWISICLLAALIAWFALLCGTYQNPMFGTGIAPDADFDGIIRSINPGLIVSVLIPLVAIGYHLYGIYRVMFIKKVNNSEYSDKDSKE
jgi:hypothetical protein